MKIDLYPSITTLDDSDLLLVETVSDGAYKKIKISDLKTAIGAASTGTGTGTGTSFPVTARYRMNAGHISIGSNPNLLIGTDDLANNGAGGFAISANYLLVVPRGLNGLPVIQFNGSQAIDLFGASIVPDPGNFVIFQVVNFAGASCSFGGGSDSWGIQMTESNMYAVCNGALVQASFPSLVNAGWHITSWGRYNGHWNAMIDGTKYDGGTNISNLRGLSNGWIAHSCLGAKYDGGFTSFFNGSLTDTAVILNPTLSDINSVGNYYKSLYNLTWNTVS